jgi:DNA mismatch repair protein MutS
VKLPSILFRDRADRIVDESLSAPDFLGDLNLDQIFAAIAAGYEEHNLTPFFLIPLRSIDAVVFRHQVMRDLENHDLYENVRAFAKRMRDARKQLTEAGKRYYELQRQRWILDAVNTYCDAVRQLDHDLSSAKLASPGMQAFRDYVRKYTTSDRFALLSSQAEQLETELAGIRYALLIRGARIEVQPYAGQPDYSAQVEATFERFQQGGVTTYAFNFSDSPDMNHVEARILELVAQLHSSTFSKLASFVAENKHSMDDTIVAFDREVHFYLAYLTHISKLQKAGLKFCYPVVIQRHKQIYASQTFDLALAGKLADRSTIPVTNDFHLDEPERVIVVSGPNQGGKTTFARTFGQLHYLASLGCPVPGSEAQLSLPDRIFSHFEREEKMTNLRGKLQDDLVRIHGILELATPQSILVINEIFASTTLRDAISLSKKIATAIIDLDALCVWVTFLDEIASLGKTTVSMVSTVVPENPARRTFKIVRRPADGLAYAMSIAEKYRLTYDAIRERVGS